MIVMIHSILPWFQSGFGPCIVVSETRIQSHKSWNCDFKKIYYCCKKVIKLGFILPSSFPTSNLLETEMDNPNELEIKVVKADLRRQILVCKCFKSFKFIISLYFALTKVRIWPLHCSLGNQNTITCKLELHAIQLKGRCTSLYAKGPQGPGIQG